jgi:hypothetical protein
MSWSIKVTCEVCGVERKETNHWFSIWVYMGEFRVQPLDLSELHGRPEDVIDVCGQEHAHRIFDCFMQHGHIKFMFPFPQEAIQSAVNVVEFLDTAKDKDDYPF